MTTTAKLKTTSHDSCENIWKVDYQDCQGVADQHQPAGKVPVLVTANDNNQTQWVPRERLHQLFERQCKQLGWRGKRKKIASNINMNHTAMQLWINCLINSHTS